MAHFAKIDQNNKVIDVVVINNNDILDEHGNESEAKGIEFCKSLFGANTNWVQTSYNGNFRRRYAAIGSHYDSDRDAFINRKPYPSWILNETTLKWEEPIPFPNDGKVYIWDESTVSWGSVPKPFPSWIPNETCREWIPPIPRPSLPPTPPFIYKWDEETISWVEDVKPLNKDKILNIFLNYAAID